MDSAELLARSLCWRWRYIVIRRSHGARATSCARPASSPARSSRTPARHRLRPRALLRRLEPLHGGADLSDRRGCPRPEGDRALPHLQEQQVDELIARAPEGCFGAATPDAHYHPGTDLRDGFPRSTVLTTTQPAQKPRHLTTGRSLSGNRPSSRSMSGLPRCAHWPRQPQAVPGASLAGSALAGGTTGSLRALPRPRSLQAGQRHPHHDRDAAEAVATRLKDCVREGDTVARVGGDEFTIVRRRWKEDAAVVAQKVLHAIAAPINLSDQRFYDHVRLDLTFPDDADARLCSRTPTTLYRAKARPKHVSDVHRG